MIHIPVLLNEVLEYLDPKPGENFIDCTIGGGSHTFAILEKAFPNGKVLGIDLDIDSLKAAEVKTQNLKLKNKNQKLKIENRLFLVRGNFANLKNIVEEKSFFPINGILLDLGMSSEQIEKSGRGFSFKKDEPLIMSYIHNKKTETKSLASDEKLVRGGENKNQILTAQEILNKWPEKYLVEIFQKYGQERFSRRIAANIVKYRKERPIKTTFQLNEIIRQAIPPRFRHQRIHFATRAFQSLRIAVNDELNNLQKVLPQALEILEPKGRIVAISFHSLEDRIVKWFFREQAKLGKLKIVTKKPITPTFEEIKKNPRARSAKMRAAIKI
jgi:16S rRNA (cytosine1402-N4)-methyltransferase